MTFNLGQAYHVTIVAAGANLDVYVDGVFKFGVPDSSYSSGRFGMTNFMSTADFDNLDIVELEK